MEASLFVRLGKRVGVIHKADSSLLNVRSVSIIINNFNYARFLSEAIDSALSQTAKAAEVIVVDDGSTDESRSVIQKYESAITAIYKENGGQASAMNVGFNHAKGDYIIFLDADDVLEPDCVKVCLAHMRPDIGRLVFGMTYIDEASRVSRRRREKTGKAKEKLGYLNREEGRMQAFAGSPTSSNCFARWALEKIMPIEPAGRFTICADQFLLLNSVAVGSVVRIGDKLVRYRVHGRNHFSVRSLSERALGTRLKNFVNRAYIKERIYGRGPRSWSPREYVSSWEDFEAILMALRLPEQADALSEVDVDWVQACLRQEISEACRRHQWWRWMMLRYAAAIPIMPVRVTFCLGALIRRLKYA